MKRDREEREKGFGVEVLVKSARDSGKIDVCRRPSGMDNNGCYQGTYAIDVPLAER